MSAFRTPNALRPKVILFDVNETLLDMSPLQSAVGKAFGNKLAFKLWFGLLLQYSLVDTVAEAYHPFGLIGEAALDMTADMLEKPRLSTDKKQELIGLMSQLPPHKDVPQGLEMLLDAGFALVALTSSPYRVLEEQLRYAELIHYFEQGLSIELCQRYKPHPSTYRMATQSLGLEPDEALLVSAHGWDVAGAVRAGLKAAFIARPGQCLYPLVPPPTYLGKTLKEVAKRIAA